MEKEFVTPKDFIDPVPFSDIMCDAAGRDCRFIKISDSVGIKVYREEEMAANTYDLQKQFHEAGYAPNCWGYDVDEKNKCYYYFTEIAFTVGDFPTYSRNRTLDLQSYIHKTYLDILTKACEMLAPEYNIQYDLYGVRNWGFLNGQPVIIDFSFYDC
jgi:hypothetical protein